MCKCSLTDKVAFNLCRQAESECENLALDVITKAVVVFEGPHSVIYN